MGGRGRQPVAPVVGGMWALHVDLTERHVDPTHEGTVVGHEGTRGRLWALWGLL